jgi:hypothetical protein
MTVKAHVRYDLPRDQVQIGVSISNGEAHLTWAPPSARNYPAAEQPGEDAWLSLNEDVARAIYDALADYFGHATNDVRQLRRDYDAERLRVDKFINFAIAVRPGSHDG